MSSVLIVICVVAILILVITILGLMMGIPNRIIKRDILATLAAIFLIVIFRIMYDSALAIKSTNIGFYVALIGGAVTITIYNAICKLGKKS